ncbi:glycosyltransferase family 2 protein [Herbiconiux sp. P15]|uniref:glycosyltransferase family 2 protein n=1 Tax=Herbiconiux liukaitaii TaxID=3342799 RepID=UPI0035BA5939
MLSVILPVHNASAYLARALSNLQASVGIDDEVIVVDDHSTDDSLALVRAWGGQIAGRLIVLENDARGVASARNLAVSHAKGDFIWFADCDDDWSPQILARMSEVAVATGADIVICNAEKITQPSGSRAVIEDATVSEVLNGKQSLLRLLRGDIEGHLWNKLFRRTLFAESPFPATRAHSDLGGMFALLASADLIAAVPEVLYTYYVHEGSVLNRKQYRWDDLWDCLALARAHVGTGTDDRRALITFTYRNVIVPTVNESVRRESVSERADIERARRRAKKAVRISDLLELVRLGQRDAAVRGLLIKFVFPIYRALYKRHRAKRWGELDAFASSR